MPIRIERILIDPKLVTYLTERRLLPQYKKAKDFLLAGIFSNASLKLREPKDKGIWYFRINKQYRAHATFMDNVLRIHDIDDHSS